MPTKQGSSKSTERSNRVTHRGIRPGDKVVNRQKSKMPAEHIKFGSDLLSHINRPQYEAPQERRSSVRFGLSDSEKANLVAEASAKAISKVADREAWTKEERLFSVAYLKYLVFGIDIPEERIVMTTARTQHAVERTFATTIWFKRSRLGDIALKGMTQVVYAANLAEAQRRFPATPTPIKTV